MVTTSICNDFCLHTKALSNILREDCMVKETDFVDLSNSISFLNKYLPKYVVIITYIKDIVSKK